ncbi:MAG: DEAD/DEAH box helicase [Nitrospiraceae bacterium]
MSDERPDKNAPPAPLLSPLEQVERQQLNILHFWSEKAQEANGVPGATGESPTKMTTASVPEHWNLLSGVQLHAWQVECRDKWFAAGKRGVVKVVTGAGKTVLACAIIEQLEREVGPRLRVAVVVPTVVLLDQWYDVLTERGNLPTGTVGRLGGGFQDKLEGKVRILISVLNSAAAKLPKMAAAVVEPLLLIVDECHRAGATQMSAVFGARRAFNLGLSATPEREEAASEEDLEEGTGPGELPATFDETLLGRELGPIIYVLNYRQALEAGILSRFVIHHFGLPLEPPERGRYERLSREITDLRRHLQSQVKGRSIDGGALVGWARRVAGRGHSALARQAAEYVSLTGQRKLLLYHAKARHDAVLRLVRDALAEDAASRIILFHEAIGEVMRLFQELRAEGFAAVGEHSQLPDSLRQESVRLFRNGAAGILVSARSLIEGFDVPAADVGIVVASSSSVRQRIQTLGRILRVKGRGSQARPAALHVLYMSETTDEMIYEKQDWESLTGAERNQYFTWDPTDKTSRATEKDGPPRRPKPAESQVDWSALKTGDPYPGVYEGADFSCDAQGNVRDAIGDLMSNPQDIPRRVKDLRDGYGRFRVTPARRAVLVPVREDEESQILLAGFLEEPFKTVAQPVVDKEDAGGVQAQLVTGAEYHGPVDGAVELRVKTKAKGSVLSRRVSGGEDYAHTEKNALAPERGRDAEALLRAIAQVEQQEGIRIMSVTVLPARRIALCEAKGKRLFLHQLTAGLEFRDQILGAP